MKKIIIFLFLFSTKLIEKQIKKYFAAFFLLPLITSRYSAKSLIADLAI
jgi:hypothetical protein